MLNKLYIFDFLNVISQENLFLDRLHYNLQIKSSIVIFHSLDSLFRQFSFFRNESKQKKNDQAKVFCQPEKNVSLLSAK